MKFEKLLAVGLSALCLVSGSAAAQDYPNKPIQVVVPFSAGSGTDIIARLIMGEMEKVLGTPFVIDNKPGAQGQIAAETVARAPADGYTLMVSTNTAHSANPWLFKNLNYDPIKDFTPIARFNHFLFVLAVNPDLPVRTVPELISYAKANSQKTAYAYGNSTGQVAAAHLNRGAKLDVPGVPYKSTPPAMADLTGGQVQYIFVDWASSSAMVKAGRVRAIGIQADKRSPLLPDVPAVGETVPGFDFLTWGGLLGPANMPKEVVDKLSRAALLVLKEPQVVEKMVSMGLEPAPAASEEFGAFLQEQLQAWGRKIKDAGIEPQ